MLSRYVFCKSGGEWLVEPSKRLGELGILSWLDWRLTLFETTLDDRYGGKTRSQGSCGFGNDEISSGSNWATEVGTTAAGQVKESALVRGVQLPYQSPSAPSISKFHGGCIGDEVFHKCFVLEHFHAAAALQLCPPRLIRLFVLGGEYRSLFR